MGPRLESKDVLELEKIFVDSNCELEMFDKNIPNKYMKVKEFDFPKMDSIYDDGFKKINRIISGVEFMTTKDTNKTKDILMKEFIKKYNERNGLTCDDYYIFACGDNYNIDGPMIKLAFALGGYGCLNYSGLSFDSKGETLRYELSKDYNIETGLSIVCNGFFDFYCRSIELLSINRTWNLANTMKDINSKNNKLINRFNKTNHYIQIRKRQLMRQSL